MSDRIDAQPSEGLTYDPNDPNYWDRELLDKELDRIYDICHGCRLCFNLCPSFPSLFDAVDQYDGDVLQLTGAERQEVVDLCYMCRLCHIKCPYTPEDGHEFQLDFPALMLRARSVRVREEGGVKLREKLLGDPDKLGRMGTKTSGIANWANNNPINRRIMESTLKIHRDKKLPDFAPQPFEKWAKAHTDSLEEGRPTFPAENLEDGAEPHAKLALFHTCYINWNNPDPGRATIDILRKNGCSVTVPEQNCCGMPALDGGNVDFAKKQAQQNVESLLPLVRSGHRITGINPTCTMMLRKEYARLVGTPEAREVAEAVVDPHELLFELKREGKLNRDFKSTPGTIAYHVPCHLKAQSIGYRSRDIMKLIPGATVKMVDACSAHDGTWAMKREYFDLSMQWGKKCFDGMIDAEADVMVTDCPLAAVQIEQGTGSNVRPIHPAEVISRAYDPHGWPNPVEEEEEPEEEVKKEEATP